MHHPIDRVVVSSAKRIVERGLRGAVPVECSSSVRPTLVQTVIKRIIDAIDLDSVFEPWNLCLPPFDVKPYCC